MRPSERDIAFTWEVSFAQIASSDSVWSSLPAAKKAEITTRSSSNADVTVCAGILGVAIGVIGAGDMTIGSGSEVNDTDDSDRFVMSSDGGTGVVVGVCFAFCVLRKAIPARLRHSSISKPTNPGRWVRHDLSVWCGSCDTVVSARNNTRDVPQANLEVDCVADSAHRDFVISFH